MNILSLQMQIAEQMEAEGWLDRPEQERLEEAGRRLQAAIRQHTGVYQLALFDENSHITPPATQKGQTS